MYICTHCGEPATDATHFFRTHDNYPYCLVSDRCGDPRLLSGIPAMHRMADEGCPHFGAVRDGTQAWSEA